MSIHGVLDAMDQPVRASDHAELQPDGATVRLMHLERVERLASARVSSLDALAREQGIGPIDSIEDLQGGPIDDFDEFFAAITSARQGEE